MYHRSNAGNSLKQILIHLFSQSIGIIQFVKPRTPPFESNFWQCRIFKHFLKVKHVTVCYSVKNSLNHNRVKTLMTNYGNASIKLIIITHYWGDSRFHVRKFLQRISGFYPLEIWNWFNQHLSIQSMGDIQFIKPRTPPSEPNFGPQHIKTYSDAQTPNSLVQLWKFTEP